MSRGWRRGLLELGLVLAAVLAWRAYLGRDAPAGPAPALAAPDLQGRPRTLADLHGRPALLHFWATWCPVCRVQEPVIAGVARDHPVLTVALQSGGADEVRSHLGKAGVDLPVILDPHGELAAAYGVRGVPASFVLDGTGHIRFVEMGYTTGPGLRLRLWWAALFPAAPAPRVP